MKLPAFDLPAGINLLLRRIFHPGFFRAIELVNVKDSGIAGQIGCARILEERRAALPRSVIAAARPGIVLVSVMVLHIGILGHPEAIIGCNIGEVMRRYVILVHVDERADTCHLIDRIEPLLAPACPLTLDIAVARILPVEEKHGLAQVVLYMVDKKLRLLESCRAGAGKMVETQQLAGSERLVSLGLVLRREIRRALRDLHDNEIGGDIGDIDVFLVIRDIYAIKYRLLCCCGRCKED